MTRSAPASPAQIRALQAQYARLTRDGDPRVLGPRGESFAALDARDARIEWARHHLGSGRVSSFNDLSRRQAEYLLDHLTGKPSKLDQMLDRLFTAAGVRDRAAWFAAIQSKSCYFQFRGCTLGQLNRWQKWQLVQILDARVPRDGGGREGGADGERRSDPFEDVTAPAATAPASAASPAAVPPDPGPGWGLVLPSGNVYAGD